MKLQTLLLTLAAVSTSTTPSTSISSHNTVVETRVITTTVALLSSVPSTWPSWIWPLLQPARIGIAPRIDSHLPHPVVNSGLPRQLTSTSSASLDSNLQGYCWEYSGCLQVFEHVRMSFMNIRGLSDPNDRHQNTEFQKLMCDLETKGIAGPKEDLTPCFSCLQQTSLETSLIAALSATFHNFCGTTRPSAYLFLISLIDILNKAHTPSSVTPLPDSIMQITTLSTLFTSSPGLNEVPSSQTVSASTITMPPFPSQYLTQIPEGWPYNSGYGLARRPGLSATFTVTDELHKPAGLVINSLKWYPRPLGKQKPIKVTDERPKWIWSTTTVASGTSSASVSLLSARSKTPTTYTLIHDDSMSSSSSSDSKDT